MSTKKRFSIPQELASGLRNSIQSASANQGQLHYDMMSIDVMETDPNNPRRLSITPEEIFSGVNPSDPAFTIKSQEREALVELSESIKRIGIKNAIEVFKNGHNYRIIAGERRFWAARLAGLKTVHVRISQKPDELNLRYTQWVENINRQDLSLEEKFNNLMMIATAYTKANGEDFSEQTLQELLGVSNIQAYRYYALLKADEKIIELIRRGKLNNLKLVQQLVSMKDKGARNQIISWISTSKDEVTSLNSYREAAGKKASSPKKAQSISLGKLSNVHTAKQLLDLVLSNRRLEKYRNHFHTVDWNSTKAITKAFKDLFKKIEKEFKAEEVVG